MGGQTVLRWSCIVFTMACLAGVAVAETATLTVNVGQPGPKISPSLYGIFFEEINHAGDGGLYAEMARNRSFEDAEIPEGWSLAAKGAAEGKMALDEERPLNEKSPHSLRLEITKTDGGSVGVANAGYWGMAIQKKAKYELSLFARCSDKFKGPLTVAIENASGRVCATGKIAGLTTDWKRFSCSLAARDNATSARLVLSAASPGTIWFDAVSLLPKKTWKDRPNGLRADLMGMLNDLKPSFVRFPGGCFVEGDVLRNAFRWKDTVGDIAGRPGHRNLWGYRSTDGLGYHEYLQMCEDLGADPMFVINCGMSHKGNVPMDELEPWVQDALDAIEYANGPTSSKWGALRAKNGHPAPFGLKYLEIGNENGGQAYEERYAQFYKAIKARYPEMQLISNTRVRSAPMDILDEHYYSSPDWFAANATKYDKYDRSGPKIYVGEYACTQGCGKGNLRAALGEAAFMTGMERNSDIVAMASYAPLFVNVNNRKWNPDAICFDSAACYGTPSYHVQKLFSRHRGDVVLPSTLSSQKASAPPVRGAIGLGTWLTQAEFKDVKVARGDQTLLEANFADGARGWRVVRGDWKVQDGAYRQMDRAADLRSTAGDPKWTDYTYTLKARKIGGAEGFLIMFSVRDNNNWFWWNLGGWGNVRHAIEKCTGGAKTILGDSVSGRIETGRWYDIKIELQGTHIRCYLDGKLIHDVEDVGPVALYAVAGRVSKSGEIILKVVNMSAAPQDTQVSLEGTGRIASEGSEVVLTSNNAEDENSLDQPTKVAPVERRLTGLGQKFTYVFPPHSASVLRLKPEK
jgi:alpha-L-arabinofuranosidase